MTHTHSRHPIQTGIYAVGGREPRRCPQPQRARGAASCCHQARKRTRVRTYATRSVPQIPDGPHWAPCSEWQVSPETHASSLSHDHSSIALTLSLISSRQTPCGSIRRLS